MADSRYLGIDAGGSNTICLVGDASAVLGRGTAGAANPSLVGVEGFRAAVAAAASEALGDLPPAPIGLAWLGVAGSERSGLREQLRTAARDALGTPHVHISHDARLMLAAAELEHGIGLVAGTGSSAYARAADGCETSIGGWGYLLGDEGSGYDIAVRALRAVTAAVDGRGPRTRLESLLTERLGVSKGPDLRDRFYPAPSVPEIASLAETVLGAAETDAVAADIVDSAADELVALVEACAVRLFSQPGDTEIPVVLAGGLLTSGTALHRSVLVRLQRAPSRYRPVTPIREPATGALALARAGAREPPITQPTVSETPATQR